MPPSPTTALLESAVPERDSAIAAAAAAAEPELTQEQAELLDASERDSRVRALGFRPQKENPWNRHLPYASRIDDESQAMLALIRENLARSVACRELIPGTMLWVNRLAAYTQLYGLKFSLDDHVLFIKLLMSLIQMPFIEPVHVNRLCVLLTTLLEKNYCLSPDQLQLEWRPLYKLVQIYIDKKCNKGQFYRFYSTIPVNLATMIECASPYFPPEATQEIMAEIYPKLYPLDTGRECDTISILSVFLNFHTGYELWLPRFLSLWETYHDPTWSGDMMDIIATLAQQNVGRIDWEPHLPTMYTRFTRSLNLPVHYKTLRFARPHVLDIEAMAEFIAWTLGPQSCAQKHLTQLAGTLVSFIHPANTGKWTKNAGELLATVSEYIVQRVRSERFPKADWRARTPAEHRLTDACITAYVQSMTKFAYQALYSRIDSREVRVLFFNLAELRPELILPGLIDRAYETLDSLTEPQKFIATFQSLITVARAIVSGHNGYTNGRTHIIPLLFAVLPGIDANDFRKTSLTLEFITSCAFLIPFVDCSQASKYHTDLTEDELLICDQTADFETFILQFLDKLFAIIEVSAQQSTRLEQQTMDEARTNLDVIAEASFQASTQGVLSQCSEPIVLAATRKLVQYVRTHLLEPTSAAPMIGSLVRVFSRVRYAVGELQRTYFPWLRQAIHTYIDEHDDCATAEKESEELQYYMTLLECYTRGSPEMLLDIADDVMAIYDRVRGFRNVRTYTNANNCLGNLLNVISAMEARDIRSSPDCFERPLAEVLPIRRWAEKSSRPIDWYVPNERAQRICEKIVHRYLPGLVDRFERFAAGTLDIPRAERERDGMAMLSLLRCVNFLPNWDDEEEPLTEHTDSVVARVPITVRLLNDDRLVVRMPNGENVRRALVRTLSALQDRILADHEDDIKTQLVLIYLWDRVHLRQRSHVAFNTQLKTHKKTKCFQMMQLCARRRNLRAVTVARAQIQQDMREQLSWPLFTATHLAIFRKLLQFSTVRYAAIRSVAQSRLQVMLNKFPQARRFLLDDICEVLALDSNAHHDRFKGMLFLVLGSSPNRLLLQNNWNTIERLWLALLRTNLSEKPSVVDIMERIENVISEEFTTLTIETTVPDECVRLALQLAPAGVCITEEEQRAGAQRLLERNARNRATYGRILEQILDITHSKSLHWRFGRLASNMINVLLHPQVPFPPVVVRYVLQSLISESLEERKLAVKTLGFVLYQQKREHVKVPLPEAVPALDRPYVVPQPGIRDDNRWLQYDADTVPKTQADWDRPRYVFKTIGFFGWPSNFQVYAPTAQQPAIRSDRAQMTESERILFDFFDSEDNVHRLVGFWSLEEKRGNEKFHRSHMYAIKCLCDMFGMRIVDRFLPHVKRLIGAMKNVEASHRCAAELTCGFARGAKHWSYADSAVLYAELVPLVRTVLTSITLETDAFWGTCFATAAENMAPQRQWWLHEVLLEDPLREERSFVDCIRIYCLQGPYNQQVWRMNSVSHRLLDYMRPVLEQSFTNVRERVGSLLVNIFETDLDFGPGVDPPEGPRMKAFIDDTMVRLKVFRREDGTTATADGTKETDDAIRWFKTVCHWISNIINHCTNGNRAEFFSLLSLACHMERSEKDQELSDTSATLLAMMAQALTMDSVMNVALDSIEEVAHCASWSARVAALEVLQVLAFHNMHVVMARSRYVDQLTRIVLRLLEDEVLEVRDKSSQVLCGLLHCGFLPDTGKLLELFKRKCRTKLTARNPASRQSVRTSGIAPDEKAQLVDGQSVGRMPTSDAELLRRRHMGVMGLCAFIAAHPYDVPDFVPEVFELLVAHVNDPQPISTSIRTVITNFKRTHLDNWSTHKLKFTENQLALISDLAIPPSYYA